MQLLWAEYRKREIGEYTSQALQAKKAQGVVLGAPRKYDDEQYARVVKLRLEGYKTQEIANITGISRQSVSRILSKGVV